MMTKTALLRLVLGFSAFECLGAGTAEAHSDTLTEWPVPFPDSLAFKVVAAGTELFYLDNSYPQRLGRLDSNTGLFTEWQLPIGGSSPSELVYRTTDGVLFATNAQAGEIAQFDPAAQLLRRWSVAPLFDGPWSLAVDEEGRILFRATDSANSRMRIGRLDTTAGTVTTWLVPEATAALSAGDMAVLPGGSVFFNVYGYQNQNNAVILDTTTGIFTTWPTSGEPAWAVATDAAGNVYFQEAGVSAIARLVPATGRLTEWPAPGYLQDDLVFASGRLFFGEYDPAGILALDPGRGGNESVLVPFPSAPVAPDIAVAVPAEETPSARQAQSSPTTREIRRRHFGGRFIGWEIPTVPRMLASAPGAIYFATSADNPIGRITFN